VFNGGMTIEATFTNVRGISPSAVATLTLRPTLFAYEFLYELQPAPT
jgi:hypothetical protein